MTLLLLLLWNPAPPDITRVLEQVKESGRAAMIAESPSEKVSPPRLIAPGPPPALSFRLLEGKARHRYGDLDLVLDDAGH